VAIGGIDPGELKNLIVTRPRMGYMLQLDREEIVFFERQSALLFKKEGQEKNTSRPAHDYPAEPGWPLNREFNADTKKDIYLCQVKHGEKVKTTDNQIISRINGYGRGRVFTPDHFKDLGSRNASNQT